ncbi:MAG: CRISPR-associated endonuclease Cas2 [Longicatena sp.]|nr:CRISPR-associated endonuclease Cas2 [Longicatena sp.]
MRIIVILSPTNKRGTKTEYTKLRKFLISDGYLRISKEVFMRITNNRKGAEKHYRRLMDYKPKTGIVRVFKLTEKQYAKVLYLTGEEDIQEKMVGNNTLVML